MRNEVFSYLTMTIIYSDHEHGFESPWLSDVNLKTAIFHWLHFEKVETVDESMEKYSEVIIYKTKPSQKNCSAL